MLAPLRTRERAPSERRGWRAPALVQRGDGALGRDRGCEAAQGEREQGAAAHREPSCTAFRGQSVLRLRWIRDMECQKCAFLLQRHCMLRCRPLPRLPSGEGLVYLPRARRFNAWALSVVRKVCTSSGACRSNARGAGCGHRHQERGSARACWSQPLLVWSLARGVQSCLGRGWRGGQS